MDNGRRHSIAVTEGDEVIGTSLLTVTHDECELAARSRVHVDPDVDNARSTLDKAGAVAIDGAVPIGVDARVGVIAQEVMGIGDGKFKLRPVEGVMLEPTAQLGLMALAVMDGNIAELDIVRDDVNGHVGRRVPAVHIVQEEAYRVGDDITLKVDGVEVAEQPCHARHLTLHIARERRHIGLEERYVGMVGVEHDVERIVGNVDAAVHFALAPVGLVDVAIDQDTLGVIVKVHRYVKVTHERTVIGDILDEQARRM